MPDKRSPAIVVWLLVAFASPALADDVCGLKGVLGGKPVSLKHCDVALYDDEHSVTLWFTDTPITPKESETFREFSNPPDKDATGKTRTSVNVEFCPGAGSATPDPKAVKSIGMGVEVAGSPFLGRQWVFELPKDKDIAKVEKLSGALKPGGRLAGRITGGKVSDGLKYEWQIDFDLALPAKSAAGGMTCPH